MKLNKLMKPPKPKEDAKSLGVRGRDFEQPKRKDMEVRWLKDWSFLKRDEKGEVVY
jgi:hypothetical protein